MVAGAGALSSGRPHQSAGGPILDDPKAQPSADQSSSGTGQPAGQRRDSNRARTAPKGIREQLSATIGAAVQVGRAHLALARAEFGEIADSAKRIGILVGLAIGLLLFAGLLLPVGLVLFAGEWLFGSIGWGVLLGSELLIGGAVALVLAGLDVPAARIAGRLLAALVAGVVLAVLLALDLPHSAFSSIGASALTSVDPANRPLVVGLALGVVVGAVLGIVVGIARRFGAAGTIGLAFALAILGLAVGVILAIDYSLRVAIALGLAFGLGLWPALVGIDTYRRGIDVEGLKNRFYPRVTIETTKETIEWVRKQRPLGPKS